MRHSPSTTFVAALPIRWDRPVGPRSTLAQAVLAALAWTVRLAGLPERIAAHRRDLALLGAMSGRDLADIGLVRQDVADAAALPLGRAPGPLLTRRAAERRQARTDPNR